MLLDAVVIGLGGVGSFALSSLSKRTKNIIGIEQFVRGHAFGSSHGGSRIYRRAYFEHSHYVPWIQYSIDAFRDLERSSGRSLLQECGTLIMEEPDGTVIASCEASAQEHGIPVERLSNGELQERYPQFLCRNTNLVGLLEPEGGFVRPELAMATALQQAESQGATVWENTKVKSIREVNNENENGLVEVIVARDNEEEILTTRSAIVTAGAWASQLIPRWQAKLRVTRQLQVWMDASGVSDPQLYAPSNMPTWYMSTPSRSALPIYGIPADPLSDNPRWIKIGLHLRDAVVSPDESPQQVSSDEQQELHEASQCALTNNGGLKWASAIKPCLYTMTPDSHFMVGQPAGFSRTFAAAGLSGHGFKMTPALGQMLCDWVLDEDTSHWKAEFLSPGRFQM